MFAKHAAGMRDQPIKAEEKWTTNKVTSSPTDTLISAILFWLVFLNWFSKVDNGSMDAPSNDKIPTVLSPPYWRQAVTALKKFPITNIC